MENLQSGEASSSRDISGENSESALQLNVKTLDSRIFSFHVDKDIVVSAFKEEIASQIGIPVGQQRLIFKGKVLKDDHLLSVYNVENGDTLHIVQRLPQPPPGSNSGQNYADSVPNNRIGRIAHNVVLGTVNVGDAGEAVVPDLSQVIGAVLNSVGLGNLARGVQPGIPTSQAIETGGSHVNPGSQSQGGNQSFPSQGPRVQSAFYPVQNPLEAANVVPSLNMPIPNSLDTLIEFMNQMESVFSQDGGQHDTPPTSRSSHPTPELPRNSHGYPSVEALIIVLQIAQQLLRDHVVQALSHTAGRLEQERGSTDPSVRGQVQRESMHIGVAMQHLGALLLELGRTILTLRLGQSPDESFVNAGHAVYISPSGPNPIMVQPFPLQNSSLFGGSSGGAMNHMTMGTLGMGSVTRNVNIHINTGGALAPIISTMANRASNGGEDMRGARAVGTDSVDTRHSQVSSGISVTASAVPSRPAGVSTVDAVTSEINSLLRSTTSGQNNNHRPSEGSTDQEQPVGCVTREDDMSHQQRHASSIRVEETSQNLAHAIISNNHKAQSEPSSSSQGSFQNKSSISEHAKSHKDLPRSIQSKDSSDGSLGSPLGLGLGLQPKKRGKQLREQEKNSDGTCSNNQENKSIAVGQQVLQSLASDSSRGNVNPPSSAMRQNVDSRVDGANAMTQVLGSPSLDGLLAGVSQQAGVGSPDMLRNMLQQFTQNPAMMNTTSQIAQQADSHDLGSMLSGLGNTGQGGGIDISRMMQQFTQNPAMMNAMNQIAQQVDQHDLGSMFSGFVTTGQGGGIDLSRMMQQMMPIVSQALGGVSSIPQRNLPSESTHLESTSRRGITSIYDDHQIDLRPVVQRLEDQSPSEDVFRSLVGRAVHLVNGGSEDEHILNELCSQGGLSQEFMEMLCLDLHHRLQDEMGS